MFWVILILSLIALSMLGLIYLSLTMLRFAPFRRLKAAHPRIALFTALAINAGLFIIFTLILSMMNAIVIFLHLVVIRLAVGGISKIVHKLCSRNPNIKTTESKSIDEPIYLEGWLSYIICAVYLGICAFLCFHVWEKDYGLETEKNLGELRVALIADSHMGTTFGPEHFAELMDEITAAEPDVLVISGDFVDDGTSREEMEGACRVLGELDVKYGVWMVLGNHDRGYYGPDGRGFTAEEMIDELESRGVHMLIDESVLIDDRFYIVGRDSAEIEDRKSAGDLVKDLDGDKYMIMLEHEPCDYKAVAESGADLVLSGHTHGGQLLPINKVGEWMGVNDRTYGYEKRGNTEFIVTSGISDWELLFKSGTKSEYVIIDINTK